MVGTFSTAIAVVGGLVLIVLSATSFSHKVGGVVFVFSSS